MKMIYNSAGTKHIEVSDQAYAIISVTKIMFPPEKVIDFGKRRIPVGDIELTKPLVQGQLVQVKPIEPSKELRMD